jgi:hypothetical protein
MADVGGMTDSLISQTDLSKSGYATELDWINSVLGGGYTMDFKNDTPDGAGWQKIVDTTGIYAYETTAEPEYFFVKTGAKSGNPNQWFLFENIGSLDWAVINLEEMGFSEKNIDNIGKISHINGYSGSQPVPEPASLVLFVIGIVGLLGIKRFKK